MLPALCVCGGVGMREAGWTEDVAGIGCVRVLGCDTLQVELKFCYLSQVSLGKLLSLSFLICERGLKYSMSGCEY